MTHHLPKLMPKVLTVWKAAGNQVGLSQEAD